MKTFITFAVLSFVFLNTNADTQSHKYYSLKKGQTQRIELPSNPTTGYSWYFSEPIEKNKQVILIGSGYESDRTGKIGAGGIQFWNIKARRPGKTSIILEYKRPWENDKSPSQTKVFTFKIQQ